MNLKSIDAALAAYGEGLSAQEQQCLAFFRKLWQAQADAQGSCAAYIVPDEETLRECRASGEPVFAAAPVSVDACLFAQTMQDIAQVIADDGSFDQQVQQALSRTKWERLVKASNLGLAGSQPGAYLEEFGALLQDDGLDQAQARMGNLVAALALKAMLQGAAEAVQAHQPKKRDEDPLDSPTCPVCGGVPAVARVGGTGGANQGRGKALWCAQCGNSWEFERVRCARCGTQNQSHLHYYNIEGDEPHRIASCDECGGYIRTVYSEDTLKPFSFEVEDVVMARLDAVAADPSFAGKDSK